MKLPEGKGHIETEEPRQLFFNPLVDLQELEKFWIVEMLKYCDGNKYKTSQRLGISVKTLYNKLHRYGVMKYGSGFRRKNQGR